MYYVIVTVNKIHGVRFSEVHRRFMYVADAEKEADNQKARWGKNWMDGRKRIEDVRIDIVRIVKEDV